MVRINQVVRLPAYNAQDYERETHMVKAFSPLYRFALALFASVAICVMAVPSMAAEENDDNEFAPHMTLYMTHTVSEWVHNPILIEAIRAQNLVTADLSEEEIIALDNEWRATGRTGTLRSQVLDSAAGDFLRMIVEASDEMITEVFVTDALGLNVAASVATSDYWQGDEDKFSKTFGVGVGAIHIGNMEVDRSTGAYQGQASMTITDPDSGLPIGSVTVGLLPDMF